MRILVLSRYGRLGASSRLRFFQYMPWFVKMGIECAFTPFFDDTQLADRYSTDRYGLFSLTRSYVRRLLVLLQKQRYDLLWIEKEGLPWVPVWIEQLLMGTAPYVLDFDDAIFHVYDQHHLQVVRRIFGDRVDTLMAGSRLVLAGNQYLAQRARDAGAPWVEIVPTVIDLDRYPVKTEHDGRHERPIILWIGSPTTACYLKLIQKPLAELRRHFPFKLRIIGADVSDIKGVDVECLPWSEATETAFIRACDIGVMPLPDSPWERGKCGYKLIQYMACGLPVVASPVGVNTEIVRDTENGFLAGTEKEWVCALGSLLGNPGLRGYMGATGRKIVEDKYCIQNVAPRLAGLLHSVAVRI